jgi:hypothetical protein
MSTNRDDHSVFTTHYDHQSFGEPHWANLVCYMRRDRPFQSGSAEIVHKLGRHTA